MEDYYSKEHTRNFSEADLFLSPNDPSSEFTIKNSGVKNIFWEERGRCISIIAFLCFTINDGKNYDVIYLSANPDSHVYVLAKLFPKITWHLYETNSDLVSQDDLHPDIMKRIKINIGKSTLDDFKRWIGRNNVIFISALRPGTPPGIPETEMRDHQTMIDQEKLNFFIRPQHSLLRFKPPNLEPVKGNHMQYMAGRTMFIPYTYDDSEETWLMPYNYQIIWNLPEYWNKMRWHNTHRRKKTTYTGVSEVDPVELKNDYDSAYEVYVLKTYLEKNAVEPTKKRIAGLSRFITMTIDDSKSLKSLRK